MFKPLSAFMGIRYVRAKRRNHFISFISLLSMCGIGLGVAVLITVLSVMNGFDKELKDRIFGHDAPCHGHGRRGRASGLARSARSAGQRSCHCRSYSFC